MNPAGEHRPCNPPLDPRGQVAVVTGGAGGIGRALGRRLHDAGASVVVLADLDPGWTVDVAAHVASEAEGPGTVEGVALDVTDEAATARLVAELTERHGSIDLWCANAGVATGSGIDADLTTWQRVWEVNVLGALHAARVLMPLWQERNRGHLMITASAAGLLTNLGDAPYSVTKHAAVGLAEWLAITHGGDGIGVSCLCPQGVRTPMLFGEDDEGLPRTSPGRPPVASPDRWRHGRCTTRGSSSPTRWPPSSWRPWPPASSSSFPTTRCPATSGTERRTTGDGSAACGASRRASDPPDARGPPRSPRRHTGRLRGTSRGVGRSTPRPARGSRGLRRLGRS